MKDVEVSVLVARVRAGDRAAFAGLFSSYRAELVRWLCWLVRDAHEAENLAQDVFLKAFEGLVSGRHHGDPFRPWLYAIARNHALDHLQKRQRVQVADPWELDRLRDAAVEPAPPQSLGWLSDPHVADGWERLSGFQRQVLALRVLADLSTGQVAALLGTSSGSVRVAQHRALASMRAWLRAPSPLRDGSRTDPLPFRRLQWRSDNKMACSFVLTSRSVLWRGV
jgi:RNA polymerase sigma-70 factor (ECF subfamily)